MSLERLKYFVNMGTLDRAIRLVIGTALFYLGLITQSLTDSTLINVTSGIFGLTNIFSAVIRICPAYLFAGFSSIKSHTTTEQGHQHSDPSNDDHSHHSQDPQESTEWSFKRKLLLSITLPVVLVLAIFTYLTYEQSKKHKLYSETGAAFAVAEMALDIETSGMSSQIEDLSPGVVAIVFHDALGNMVPSVIEKLPPENALADGILSQIAMMPTDQEAIWTIADKKLLVVSDSLPAVGLHVSVFYDTTANPNHNISPLLSRLGFTALLAIWLSGWAAYYVIKRYTTYVNKSSEAIKYRSTHDLLTGLPNRSGLEEILTKNVKAAIDDNANGIPQPFAVLVIDIANFHYFNDTLGHKLGDELLNNVATKLKGHTQAGESLVRLNGDVFCVVTPVGCDTLKASLRADQIHASMCEPMLFQNIQIDLQYRIGVANFPEHTSEGLDLLRLGIIALKHAKNLKINVSVYDDSKNTHSVKKLTIVTGLASAIEDDQLYLAYQPKIDVVSGQLSGVEALIRWEHPVYKNVPPFEFIGWAEKSGVINPLTQWVLKEAEQQCQRWREQGYVIPIAINLSPVNLHDDAILDAIKLSVTQGSFREGLLELEITENAVVQEAADALFKMTEMHSLGVPISIDDFGTGLASFSYLRKFPVSNIKIDRSFVNIDDPDNHDQILLRSMIELGHNLNCVVTAEGVENEKTLELLRSLGCDYAQGYHICRPTSACGVIDWMNDNKISVSSGTHKSYLRNVA